MWNDTKKICIALHKDGIQIHKVLHIFGKNIKFSEERKQDLGGDGGGKKYDQNVLYEKIQKLK